MLRKEEENAIYLDYKTIQPGKDGTGQLIPTVRPDIINRNQRLELECNIFLGYDHPDMSVMFTPVSSGTWNEYHFADTAPHLREKNTSELKNDDR